MQALIDDARPLVQFGLERRLANHDLTSAEGRARALPDALSVLAPIKDSILAKDYAVQLAQRLRVREEDALGQLARLKKPRIFDEDEGASTTPAQDSRLQSQLSEEEENRRVLERELLGTFAQNPLEALPFADQVVKTRWHAVEHERIAAAVIGELMQNLNASPAALVEAAAQAEPKAASLLTAVSPHPDASTADILAYILQELEIGDLEDEAAHLKSQMLAAPDGSAEESELFRKLVSLQEQLVSRQKARKPLV